jgi:SAM-dependent methyltransferase
MPGFYATIARYYDSEHADKDEDLVMYSELADEADGDVLVIGSGTGRLVMNLAAQGHDVHGIEIEPAMFDRARAKRDAQVALARRISFHLGDALRLSLAHTFSLIIIPYNTLMHFLTLEDQIALLKRCREWLKPGGLLAIDLPNAGDAFGAQDNEAVTLERTFIEQETGHLVMQQSVSRLDRVTQVMEVTWIYDEITGDGALLRTVVPVSVRYFFQNELILLMRQTGFSLREVFGDFDGSPFEDGAPRMIVVAN